MATETVTHFSASAPRPLRAFLHPGRMLLNLWGHRGLTLQLTHRDIVGRYRAARLGLLWSVLTPLVLLAIYTFVFSVVFGARWGDDPTAGRCEFALYLFCGMLVFNVFGELASRAPMMVVYNPNYVKKVVFPLEVLPVSGLLTALFNMVVGFGAWLVFWWFVKWTLPPVTALWLPVVVLPVCLATLGIAWLVASVGVFVRDVGHAVMLIVQVLFFATPVLYKMERVPRAFQLVMVVNPLSHCLEDSRRVMIEGTEPNWLWWGASLVVSIVLAVLGYAFFMKSKRAFADVL